MKFRFYPLRFSFVAWESIYFPSGKSGNVLRGALGTILRRRSPCVYARTFEPSARGEGPSGLADWPRPFVFRAIHLDGRTFLPGASFHFDLNLFDTKTPAIEPLVLTFAELAREGLGAGRAKVDLVSVERLDRERCPSNTIYEASRAGVRQDIPPLELDLAGSHEPVQHLRVRFVTPTELKGGNQIVSTPEFGILAARARDRISTLRELYGDGPLPIDHRDFGERAKLIRMTRCELRRVNATRRSSRTGQVHAIGGFVGQAEYEGDLAEFVPYLGVARWTGIGRQTVWGKGEIEIEYGG